MAAEYDRAQAGGGPGEADGVVIIGAGLTGLSAAWHLGGGHILEREGSVGGLCRSYGAGGFTFDFTGHLLHLRDPYVRELVDRLAPASFEPHLRRARVWSHGRLTDYPFQANLYGLPREVIEECLEGLREAERERARGGPRPDDFRRWVLATFGPGIARHFMLPYNSKLWRVPLEELTTDWVEGMVPVPRLEDAERGARERGGVSLGYNVRFLYPARGGIGILPAAFAASLGGLHLGREVVEVDAERRRVTCRNGESHHYEHLISTMPLPALVRCLKSPPPGLAAAAEGLRYVSVWDLNLGVARERVSGAHWIYFPGEEFSFYRVGFPSNFSRGAAPEGSSSIYVETAHLPGEPLDGEEAGARAMEGLARAGLITPGDTILFRDLVHIPYAYVIFDRHRRRALPALRKYLEGKNIYSAGRYGGWEYYSMEEAILAGRSAAAMAGSRRGR